MCIQVVNLPKFAAKNQQKALLDSMFASTVQWYQSTATPAANVLKISSMIGKTVPYQLINCTKKPQITT